MNRFSSSQNTKTSPDTSSRVDQAWLQEVLLVAVACAIALIFRVVLLDKLSFWVDEAISVIAAKGLFQKGAPILPTGDMYQRSFAHVWVLAQTFKLLGISEFSARLPSVFFGIASIAATFYFSKLLGFRRAGFITMFVLVFSPWAIWFSREARMYALLQLVYLLALYFLWLGFERQSGGREPVGFKFRDAVLLLLAAIFFVVGFSTHELMALLPIVFWLYATVVFLSVARQNGWAHALKGRYGIVAVGGLLLGVVVSALVIASGKVTLNSQVFGKIVEEVIPRHLIRTSYFGMAKRFVFEEPFATAMAFIGSIVLIKSKEKSGLFLLLSFWIPAIAMAAIKMQMARYLYFVYPTFVLIASIGFLYLLTSIVGSRDLESFLKRAGTSPQVLASLAIVVIALSISQIHDIRNQPSGRVPQDDFMVAYYPNWRLASKIDTTGKKIIVVAPVPTYYYFGRTDYYTRLADPNKWNIGGKYKNIDRYVGSRYLRTFKELKYVLEKYDCVFVIQTGLWDIKLTDEARNYISKNLRYENRYSDPSIAVFTTRHKSKPLTARSTVNSNGGN